MGRGESEGTRQGGWPALDDIEKQKAKWADSGTDVRGGSGMKEAVDKGDGGQWPEFTWEVYP